MMFPQVTEELLDATVANLQSHHPQYRVGDRVPRGGERVSLTVRRVEKVRTCVCVCVCDGGTRI